MTEHKREMVLDLMALHAAAGYSPFLERHLMLEFIGTVEHCLGQMANTTARVHRDRREWESVMHELADASSRIHASQLAALCHRCLESGDNAVSRIGAYLDIKDAYERVVVYARHCNLLSQDAKGMH